MCTPAPYRRRVFLRTAGLAAGVALFPRFAANSSDRAALQSVVSCVESAQQLIDIAATVEALAVTWYYRATQGELFSRLNGAYRNYLRAALDQERAHYLYLIGRGGQPLATQFFFPQGIFGFDNLAAFLVLMQQIETTTIGMYLAGVRRCGELGLPAQAAALGQILGIETEQRIMGREMEQQTPPPPNDRCFERALVCVGAALNELGPLMRGGPGYAPHSMPDQAAIDAAVGSIRCLAVAPAAATICPESTAQVLDIAAVAEGIGITFYYAGIRAGFFQQLFQQRQWYLQAALDEERQHLALLTRAGAAQPPARFFFPANTFTDLAVFLGVLELLEDVFISAYIAAIQRFSQLRLPLLAEIAGQILGVEAGHRALGRVMASQTLPSNLCFERAATDCLSDAAAALAPFVQGSADYTLQAARPADEQITAAVDRFTCTPIALATSPSLIYLPSVAR